MGDRWRRLGHEILYNNFILTWNHGFSETAIPGKPGLAGGPIDYFAPYCDERGLYVSLYVCLFVHSNF